MERWWQRDGNADSQLRHGQLFADLTFMYTVLLPVTGGGDRCDQRVPAPKTKILMTLCSVYKQMAKARERGS